ncbi:MAG: ATP-dependent helicase [Acidimicrobiia bacterium]|nr:ATP-dependent helicase [Acidimicrobiia bacterium]
MSTIQPSPEQQAIIDHPLEPLRVDAGAGTGKTTTMALRLVELLERGPVDTALGITFTNKAAQELRTRIDELRTDDDLGRVDVTTYHGFAHALLTEFGAYVGVERAARLITPGFVRQQLHEALREGTYQALDLTSAPHRVEDMATLAGHLSNHLLAAADVAQVVPGDVGEKRAELLTALARYEDRKRTLGLVDYGDLIRLGHTLLIEQPAVAALMRDRYQIVLLDEYQDTNPAQRELLRSVFGDGFPVTSVGDADQTIYEWRGASLENFAGFPHHFPTADGAEAVTLPLTVNRRSGSAILDAANAIAERITTREHRHGLRAVDGAPAGDVGHGWFRTAHDEARWIAELVLEEAADGRAWSDMAIIFRKNAQIPLIREALANEDIPTQVVSLGGLLQVPEVADLWAWLRILDDPSDSPALLRVLLGSHFQLGMGDLVPLADWVRERDGGLPEDTEAPGFSLLEAAFQVPDLARPAASTALERFRALYTELVEDAQGVTLVELCRRTLAGLGAWIEVEALSESAARSARLNLYRFLDLAESWSPLEGRPSLTAFLGYLSTLQEESAPEELDLARVARADAVTLITAHRAKGLEWGLVILPAAVQGTFPSGPRAYDDPFSRPSSLPFEDRLDASALPRLDPDDDKARKAALRPRHWDQEWRTAYVAATRAKDRLIVTGAHWYGGKRAKGPSELFELITDQPDATVHATCDDPGERPETHHSSSDDVAPDPLFDDGWGDALRRAVADPQWSRDRAESAAAYDDDVNQLSLRLDQLPDPIALEPDGPGATSVSGLVTYATCPQRFFWSAVDRLPRRPAPWLRRGIELHRKIELHNRGVVPLELAEPDTYDFAPDEAEPRPDAYTTFQASRFGQAKPRWVEVPFRLTTGDTRISGRIDAVYDTDGTWEVVDFKSGRHRVDPARRVQLQAYAVAIDEGALGSETPDALAVTFAYFGDGLEEVTETVDAEWLTEARDAIGTVLTGIADEQYAATPSPACHHCDFTRFCVPGKAWLAANPA